MRNDNVVEEIKNRVSILDVVGKHVQLKRAGSNYKGNCPFHSEKTASFIVSEDKQIFTCFGCGATGDVIEFVKRIEGLNFIEAAEKLAVENGIEFSSRNTVSDEKKNGFYEINRNAAMFFYENFLEEKNKGRSYMDSRGISNSTLKKFGIGYAKDSWDNLYKAMLDNGILEKDLIDVGLVGKNSEGKYFDKFRNRIIFPIINTRGKIIGFGGRAVGDDIPKYLNSPETIIFLKKNNLFGLNINKKEIQKVNCAILVEGYMDVIGLYSKGIKNAVASLGTALTENQANMIKRYADNVIICYDADQAGKTATQRAIEILYRAGSKIKVLTVSDAKDPDEYIKKFGSNKFIELMEKAPNHIEYKISEAKSKYDFNTTQGSVDFFKDVVDTLKTIKSSVEADIYIEKLSKENHLSEGALRSEVFGNNKTFTSSKDKINIPYTNNTNPKGVGKLNTQTTDIIEQTLIKLTLVNAIFVKQIQNEEKKENNEIFINEKNARIFDVIKSIYKDDEEIDTKLLIDMLSQEDATELEKIKKNILINDNSEQIFYDCVSKIEEIKLKDRQDEILKIMQVLDDENNIEQILSLTLELTEIRNRRVQWRKKK